MPATNHANTVYPVWRDDDMLTEAFCYEDGRFELYADGLYYLTYNDNDPNDLQIKRTHFVCSPIRIIAKTRDNNSNAWGRLLEWRDEAEHLHKWAMPVSLLQADARHYRSELASQGLIITTNAKVRNYLDAYLQMYPTPRQALCVDKLGWNDDQYVLPTHTLGGNSEHITVYQPDAPATHALEQKGVLEQWQQTISIPIAEQSRVIFAMCCAFAGQLLEPLAMEGGGFHILGGSSMGKSIGLEVASSVWGSPDNYVMRWRATDNGMEGMAKAHNDGIVLLDEIGEVDPKVVGKAVYMLANGKGKTRMAASGGNRPTTSWRVIFLSNGEVSLHSYMQQAGYDTKAGQEVRLIHIEADAGTGHKSFDSLVLADTGEKQADILKSRARQFYGTAGMAWLNYITSDKAAARESAVTLIESFMQEYSEVKSQAHRVARRFALVAAAGEMATQSGVTGWQEGQATKGVRRCLDNWIANYGNSGNHEERQVIGHIAKFLQKYSGSRFQDVSSKIQLMSEKAGYYRHSDNTYLFGTEVFSDICQPYDKKQVLAALKKHGLLHTNGDRYDARINNKNVEYKRAYIIKSEVINFEIAKSTGKDGNLGINPSPQGLEDSYDDGTALGTMGTQEYYEAIVPTVPTNSQATNSLQSPVDTSSFPSSHTSQAKTPYRAFIDEVDDEIPPYGESVPI